MGNVFSGQFGRRSSRPFFDELPRVAAGEYRHLAPGLLTVVVENKAYAVQLVRVAAGCMFVPRLVCSFCGRTCRVVYLRDMACCYRCTGARYRTQSESPGRRALRRSMKIFKKYATKIDYKRPQGKPAWVRWPTFEKLSAEADAVWPVIEADENSMHAVLDKLESKLDTPKRKRRKLTI